MGLSDDKVSSSWSGLPLTYKITRHIFAPSFVFDLPVKRLPNSSSI